MDAIVSRIRDYLECMRVRPLLQSYLDGELADEQGAAVVARHLEACRRCGMAADSIKAVKGYAARLRQDPTPEQIARVEQVIDELTDRAPGPDG